jgi:hypothetical protein
MSPRILEYENGRIKITAEAFAIRELNDIIKKYDSGESLGAEPYLMYVHMMSAIDSPYINMETEERKETVIYDIYNTLGEFDSDDPLLERATNKLKYLYMTPVRGLYEEIGQELIRLRLFLQEHPIEQGKDGNLSERMRLIQNVGSIITNYKKAEQQADEELKSQTRGDQEMGEY